MHQMNWLYPSGAMEVSFDRLEERWPIADEVAALCEAACSDPSIATIDHDASEPHLMVERQQLFPGDRVAVTVEAQGTLEAADGEDAWRVDVHRQQATVPRAQLRKVSQGAVKITFDLVASILRVRVKVVFYRKSNRTATNVEDEDELVAGSLSPHDRIYVGLVIESPEWRSALVTGANPLYRFFQLCRGFGEDASIRAAQQLYRGPIAAAETVANLPRILFAREAERLSILDWLLTVRSDGDFVGSMQTQLAALMMPAAQGTSAAFADG